MQQTSALLTPEMDMVFTIKIEKEEDGFVGYVLENNISSCGDTEEHALAMTQEALSLWVEWEIEYRLKKIHTIAKWYIDIRQEDMSQKQPSFQVVKTKNHTYTAWLSHYASTV